MKVGDLVKKTGGFNPKNRFFSGLIVDFIYRCGEPDRIKVLCFEDGELEVWVSALCKVINESR